MKSSNIISTKDINFNFKATLDRLGAALIFPLSFLAFVCFFLGLSFSLPSEWFITEWINSLTTSILSLFPYLAFISIVNVFDQNKNEKTILSSLIFIMTILELVFFVNDFFKIEITFNLFSSIIISFLFLKINKLNIYDFLWVLIALLCSLILIPIFIVVNFLINLIGNLINHLPIGLNSFTYGFLNRLLIPFGLHSLMIPTFAWSSVGGYAEIYNGTEVVKVIEGDSPIWIFLYSNGIKDFASTGFFVNDSIEYTYKIFNTNVVGQYQQGFLPITTFTFPIVAITYCYVNGFEKGKMLLVGSLLTMFSGVTETTEFLFILTNPFLYILNATIVGLSFMFCNLLNVHVWLSTGWLFDIILFGLIPSIKGFETHWYWIPVIGISLGIIYSVLFLFIEKKSD